MSSRVKTITVSNIKAVKKMTADFKGCTAIITAGNNKGKTTFLKSLMDRMRSIKTDRILREGETEGEYSMELTTGEKIVWTLKKTAKGTLTEKMRFTTERNIETSLTKDMCEHFFPKVFDVDRFLEAMPAAQKKILEKLVGIDFSEIDKLIAAAKEDRTFQNRKVGEEEARLTEIYDNKLSKEPNIDLLQKLETELSTAAAHNERVNGVVTRLKDKTKTVTSLTEEKERLKKRIEEIDQQLMQEETDIDKGNVWLAKNKLKDDAYMADLRARLSKCKEENKNIENNNLQKTKLDQFEITKKNADFSEKEVKKLETEKLNLVKNSTTLPEGFGFSDEGITYNGFEFSKQQLSLSAIYIAALKLASIGLGDVKTLYFDASPLDKNNLIEIMDWASTMGLQLLIERPNYEGGEMQYDVIEE